MYCDMPKAASSTWIRIMYALTGRTIPGHTNVHNLALTDKESFLYSYPLDEQLERLRTNYKVMFVRHPFERLLSAFGNKVQFLYFCVKFYNIT